VRVGFDKLDPRILPDMSVKVAFQQTAETPATATRSVLVPKKRVAKSRRTPTIVFTVQDGHAERRAVTVSDTQGDDAVLSAGVTEGEKSHCRNAGGDEDGAAVKEKKS